MKILLTMSVAKNARIPIPPEKDYKIWDSRTAGFGIRVYSSGIKSWIFQKKLNGISSNIVIGPFPSLSLESKFNPTTKETSKGARELAEEAAALLRQGLDPKLEKGKQVLKTKDEISKIDLTIMRGWNDYIEQKTSLAGNKRPTERTIKDWRSAAIKLQSSPLWKKPLLEVRGSDLLNEFIRLQKTATSTNATNSGMTQASCIIRYLRAVFNYNVIKHGLDSKNPFKQLNLLLPEWQNTNTRKRHIGESEGSLKIWWNAVNTLREKNIRDSVAIADWLQLSIFFGTRKTELISLEWVNVDLKNKLIVFPEETTKGRREHIIPLTEHVYTILDRRYKENISRNYIKRDGTHVGKSLYVFQASRKGTKTGKMTHIVSPSKSISNIVKSTGVNFSAHDLRRTFATLLSEDGANVITIENALNHSPSSTAAKSYVNNPRIKDLRKIYQSLEDSILTEVGVKSPLPEKVEISLEDYALLLKFKKNQKEDK